jgi:hypothetical protein
LALACATVATQQRDSAGGERGQPDDVFIVLPEADFLPGLLGFREISEADNPQGLTMLVGDEVTFAKLFPGVAAKLHNRQFVDE